MTSFDRKKGAPLHWTRQQFLRRAQKCFGSLFLWTCLLGGQFFAAAPALGITVAEALDNGTLSFTTDWSGQTASSYFGGSAAQSATIPYSQSSSLVTTVTGPGLLRFYWKVSSEAQYDLLRVYLDNVDQSGGISGEVSWAQRTIPIAAGSHEVRWTYSKDGSVSSGSDAGWLDKVEFIPLTPNVSFLKVAAANTHTLAVRADGTLWAWGDNTNGRLGDGTYDWRPAPVQLGSDTNWTTMSSFYELSVALKSDGSLWAWGPNNYGQLGDGTTSTTRRLVPGRVGTASDWTAAAVGSNHTVALKSDGTLWTWGSNAYGQLGIATTTSWLAVPSRLGTDGDWAAVSAGDGHSVALKTNGTLWSWGDNYNGELGGTRTNSWIPTQIGSASNWIAVAAGGQYTIALKSDGTLWAWGSNYYGQLGNGTFSTAPGPSTPAQVGSASDWVGLSAGYTLAVAVKSNGTLWTWGNNYYGQLGDGTNVDHYIPVQVGTATNWWSGIGGAYHAVGLATDGSLWAWGRNQEGQIGDGTESRRVVPAKVGLASNWAQVAAGEGHTVARRSDGTLWTWGANGSGQLGDGSTVLRSSPVQVGSATDWSAVAAGSSHTVALKSDGTLWAWGYNAYGQLGNNGAPTNSAVPVQVGIASDWIAVAAGDYFTIAMKSNHTLWAWGYNLSGRLGVGSTTSQFVVPTQVGLASDWAAVSAGYGHAVALKSNGTLWAWGYNYYGQVGNNSAGVNALSPVQVGTSTWSAVSAGNWFTLAIRSDGTLWAWGYNAYGQLGNSGAPTNSAVPVQVGTATNWTAAAAGNYHSLARQLDGTLWGWGSNITGSIGDGTTTQKNSPVQVGTATDWALPSARGHSAALKSDGTLWTWGWNGYGQLGGGGNILAYTPIGIIRSNPLTVTVSGNGVVSSDPTGINCGAICSAGFAEGSQVTLTATPGAGESFLGWGGVCTGTGSCVVSVDAAKSVTASFSDSVPDAISFAQALDVTPGQSVTSAPLIIGGINVPVVVSVTGGDYSIGCTGSFTSSNGTIANGDSVCVRHTASSSYGTVTETILTVGLGQGVFRSVTLAAPDTTPNPFSASLLYIPNPDANSVTVVDPAAGAVIDTIKVGLRPVAVATKADGSRVYVANRGSNTVSVIDTASNRVVAHLASGVEPLSLAQSPDDSRLYMGVLGCMGQSWIYVGQTATGTVGRAVPMAFPPYLTAADPAGRYFYAAGVDSGCNIRLAIVDQANDYSVRDNIQLKAGSSMMDTSEAAARDTWGPRGIAVKAEAAGSKIYVSSSEGVRVYKSATDTVGTHIGTAREVYGAALSPDGSRLYVVEKTTDKLLVIDTATDTIVTEVGVVDQPSHVALNADGSRIYVLSQATGVIQTRDVANAYQLLTTTTGITAGPDLNGQFAATLQTGFVPKKAAAPGAETVSNAITVTGINQPVSVNLDAGWYRINGETQWTAAGVQRQVNNNDQIQVKLAAAAEADATLGATLDVAGIAVPFWVTTPFAGVEVAPMTPPKYTVHSSVALNSVQISKSVNMADYVPAGASVPFAINGGMYSRNGGPFTVEPGMTSNADTFVLRALAPAVNGTVQSVLLIVNGKTVFNNVEGGAVAAFSVTSVLPAQTPKADTEPNAFVFNPVVNATPNQPQESNAITVSGLDGQNLAAVQGGQLRAPISVVNGRYRINAEAFRSDGYFVQNGDTVVVEHTPTGGTTWAELTIGTLAPVRFEVTTDALAPALPAGLAATVASSFQINLSWTASTDNVGVTSYKVYRDGTLLATLGVVTGYGDSGLAAGRAYSYTVAACDAAGNCSGQSTAATATTPDTQAPTVPVGLTAAAAGTSQINLTWTASIDNVGVTSYKVYRGVNLRTSVNGMPPVTSYSDTGLTPSSSYSYTVRACDAAGNCSAQSDAASAATPGDQSFTPNLGPGWNLLGNSLDITLDVAAVFGTPLAPVADVSANIASIWKWDAANSVWAYYSPQLSAVQINSFTASKGYLVLSGIGPGEGYWINAAAPFSMAAQSGAPFSYSSVNYALLPPSWNLIATAQNVSPTVFANTVSVLAAPANGANTADTFVSLWAWDAAQGAWYYYSPVLENTTGEQGGLTAVKNFATSKGYLHFQDYTKMLGIGTGFWVNKP